MTIAIAFTVLAIALTLGSTLLQSIGRVRFGLRDMMLMILGAGACFAFIVSANRNAEMLAAGVFGLVLWVAVLISSVARASMQSRARRNVSAGYDASEKPEPEQGEPPHGPESDR